MREGPPGAPRPEEKHVKLLDDAIVTLSASDPTKDQISEHRRALDTIDEAPGRDSPLRLERIPKGVREAPDERSAWAEHGRAQGCTSAPEAAPRGLVGLLDRLMVYGIFRRLAEGATG